MIIAIVGSGGKTTLIRHLAEQYRREGKRVLVTTTTHMFIEADTLLTDDADTIIHALHHNGCVMAGLPDGIKIKPLSDETFRILRDHADVVLVEADGSRHMALKYPSPSEPVIPEGTDRIIVVWGPHGLNRPARDVCHRLELVTGCLGIEADTLITPEHVRILLEQGYLRPLGQQFPEAEILVQPPLP